VLATYAATGPIEFLTQSWLLARRAAFRPLRRADRGPSVSRGAPRSARWSVVGRAYPPR